MHARELEDARLGREHARDSEARKCEVLPCSLRRGWRPLSGGRAGSSCRPSPWVALPRPKATRSTARAAAHRTAAPLPLAALRTAARIPRVVASLLRGARAATPHRHKAVWAPAVPPPPVAEAFPPRVAARARPRAAWRTAAPHKEAPRAATAAPLRVARPRLAVRATASAACPREARTRAAREREGALRSLRRLPPFR